MGEIEQEEARLLDDVRALIAANGPADFLFAPIVLPTDEFFPDSWNADLPSAKALLARLLARARLGGLKHSLRFENDPTWHTEDDDGDFTPPHHDAAGFFAGVNHFGTYLFGLRPTMLEDPLALAGVLAHETAHAWRFRRDITSTHDATEERLTDVSSVFLGFGVLSASIAHRGDPSLDRRGYLPAWSTAFLLAIQLVARNDRAQWEAVVPHLPYDVGVELGAVRSKYERKRGELLERLGLPPESTWSAKPPPTLPAPWRAPVRATHELVFRVNRPPLGTALALLATVTGAVALGAHSWWPLMGLLLTPLALLKKRDVCSGCAAVVPPLQRRCARCGGDVVGRIRRRSDHAAAERAFLSERQDDTASEALDVARRLLESARSDGR